MKKARGGAGGRKAKSAKKSSLPSFDFSDDLLKKAPGEAKEAAAQEAKAAGETADPPAPASPPASRVFLPAFGFAEDLLGQRQAETAAAPAEPAAGAPAGEERIFEFADRLKAAVQEEEVRPRRLETWVTLGLAGETFALPVEPVREILRISSITRVPHAPYPIRGVTNIRGRVIPVIDLRIRIELPEGETTRASRIIVVSSRGRLLGLLVDAVYQVVHLDLDLVQPPPEDVMTVQSDYIRGVYHMGDQLLLLLDVDRVLIIREAEEGLPAARAASGDRGQTAPTNAQGAP